uniref:BRISC and BRCA1-A complex member 1 n=1 Tax=Bracon brevicornis TaxID=1563983 RepID=A0A6V7LHV7_9HYME
MSDKFDTKDEILQISRKFEAISTADHSINSNNQPSPSMSTSSPVSQDTQRRITAETMSTTIQYAPNLPERVIFAVDTVREDDCTQFEIGSGAKFSPLTMIKRVIEVFICAKASFNRKHEFALMKLTERSAEWICDFTDNKKNLFNHLERIEDIQVSSETTADYDLTPCFEIVERNLPRTHLTRVVLIYTRSHCLPMFSDFQQYEMLMSLSKFFTDVLYVHERPTDDNECEDVYLKLGELDIRHDSYIYEVARNAATLHNTMAKLLAHPLQRPKQDDTSYTSAWRENSPELQTNV